MKTTLTALSLLALALSLASPAMAQTRLGVEVGLLAPTGDFGDSFDSSPWFGGRVEYQPTNPLGQVATLGLFARAAYADLQPSSALSAALELAGEDDSASYFDFGAGARVYSVALPFFVEVAANYASIDSGGESDSGFAPHLGVGWNFGVAGIFVEAAARGHAYMGDGDSQNFFTFTVAAGLPF